MLQIARDYGTGVIASRGTASDHYLRSLDAIAMTDDGGRASRMRQLGRFEHAPA